jgi:NADPH:quinone reductase-like Zn-dependent oxidoreductase
VIDYKTQNFEDILNDYDAAFDTIGGETYKRSFKVLKKDGIIVSMLEQPNLELMNQYGVKAIFQFTQVNRDRLTKLAQWVDENTPVLPLQVLFVVLLGKPYPTRTNINIAFVVFISVAAP